MMLLKYNFFRASFIHLIAFRTMQLRFFKVNFFFNNAFNVNPTAHSSINEDTKRSNKADIYLFLDAKKHHYIKNTIMTINYENGVNDVH